MRRKGGGPRGGSWEKVQSALGLGPWSPGDLGEAAWKGCIDKGRQGNKGGLNPIEACNQAAPRITKSRKLKYTVQCLTVHTTDS